MLSTYTATELPDRAQYGRRSYDIRTLGNTQGPFVAQRRGSEFPFNSINDRPVPPNPPETPEFNYRFGEAERICGGTYTLDAIGPGSIHYPPTFLPGASRFTSTLGYFNRLFWNSKPRTTKSTKSLEDFP